MHASIGSRAKYKDDKSIWVRARILCGVLLKEFLKYQRLAGRSAPNYLVIRNRGEHLEMAADGTGHRCLWQWTSDLHAPKVIPALGRLLMRRALEDHSIVLAEAAPSDTAAVPRVSFIIGHRGLPRLPHLLATIRSIGAQQAAAVECIVVEQDVLSHLGPHLPPWVRLVHTPPPSADMPYCRSWAFNIGIQHARSAVLVLHDNDMLVPVDYAAQILSRVGQGYDVVNLKRFVFYLTQRHTNGVFAGSAGLLDASPEAIVQNLEGGGSVAITRAGYDQIGGLDESFVGWGGEDNEFWERAQTLRVWFWGYMPLVHLWHGAQLGKHDAQYQTGRNYRELKEIDPQDRIRHLLTRPSGQLEGPAGFRSSQ